MGEEQDLFTRLPGDGSDDIDPESVLDGDGVGDRADRGVVRCCCNEEGGILYPYSDSHFIHQGSSGDCTASEVDGDIQESFAGDRISDDIPGSSSIL